MDNELSLVEHLTELRKRLIIVACVFVLSLGAGFWFSPDILEYLKGQEVASVVNWNVFHYTDGFMIYFKSAIVLSILPTLPVLLYQIWAFVKPGLLPSEAKGSLIYVPLSFFLFLIGVAFSYFIVFPMVISFMSGINQHIGATETYGINQYFSFMFSIIFPISILFEMPVVILFLTKLGIVDPEKLRKVRKVAYFALVVIGVSLTPPDFVSDLLIILPLFILFEVSILLSAFSIKRSNSKR